METKQNVYRPLFIAQTNLVKSLKLYKNDNSELKCVVLDKISRSNPVEPLTEDFERRQNIELVRKLSDISHEPRVQSSKYIKRYMENKANRHENTFMEYQKRSLEIQNKIYSQIEGLCLGINSRLNRWQTEIDRISDNLENIGEVKYEQLQNTREEFTDLFDEKREDLQSFYRGLRYIEKTRLDSMVQLMGDTRNTLVDIAHLLPNEIDDILDKESLMFNYSVVANYTKYSDLVKSLRVRDIENEFILSEKWTLVKVNLRNENMEVAINQFITHVDDISCNIYEIFEECLYSYVSKFAEIKHKVKMLFQEIKSVEFEQLDAYLEEFHRNFPKVEAENENLINSLKEDLNNLKLAKIQELKDQKSTFMISLREVFETEDHEVKIEEFFENFIRILKNKTNLMNSDSTLLMRKIRVFQKNINKKILENYVFVEKALKLSKNNENTLNLSFEEMDRKILVDIKENKDYLENIEKRISQYIEDMRQDWTEDQLRENYEGVTECLEKIRISYDEFAKNQITFLNSYPHTIDSILVEIKNSYYKYFSCYQMVKQSKKSGTSPLSPKRHVFDLFEDSLLISDDFFENIVKSIEDIFNERYVRWKVQIEEKTREIVEFKSEDVKSELQIKLNLLKPRKKRIEIDIYKFRIDQLISHYGGIDKSLGEVRGRLKEMSDELFKLEHSQSAKIADLYEQISRLEGILDETYHMSKFVKVRTHYESEMENCGQEIKASYRNFRTVLEGLMGESREKIFELVKSFKLICDGGSYSTGEVSLYRIQVQKVSQEIDSTELSLIEQLESSESKKMTQYTKICSECQHLLAEHVKDVTFLKEIGNILTNCQIKIKSEAAKSNGKAKMLFEFLENMKNAVEYSRFPHYDKKKVPLEEVKDQMSPIFEEFKARAEDLQCLKCSQGLPDLQINVISEMSTKSHIRTARNEDGNKISRQINNDVYFPTVPLKTASSRRDQWDTASRGSDLFSAYTKTMTKREKLKMRLKQFEIPPNSPQNFMLRNKLILHNTILLLTSKIETFFKIKSGKPKSRILADGNENLEESSNSVVTKLENFLQQVTLYQRNCVNEYGNHVRKLLQYSVDFIESDFDQMTKLYSESMAALQNGYKEKFEQIWGRFDFHKKSHDRKLFPILGHPRQREKLSSLLESEDLHQKEIFVELENFAKDTKKSYASVTEQFVENFLSLSTFYLNSFGDLITEEEIIFDDLPPERKPIEALLYWSQGTNKVSRQQSIEYEGYSLRKESAKADLMQILNKITKSANFNRKLSSLLVEKFESQENGGNNFAQRKVRQIVCEIGDRANIMNILLEDVDKDFEDMKSDRNKWSMYWSTCIGKIKDLYNPNK